METIMKLSLKTAKFAAIFALALGAAVPATFIATPAAAAGYHEMHRDGRFDHRGRGEFRGWHSERGFYRHDHRDHGFWYGR